MGIERLQATENCWETEMGGWFAGERVVFRGKDLHEELVKELDWMGLYLFSITGCQYSDEQLKVLNAIWTYTSFPDPRLWNNQVAALAGTARSTPTLALSAAMAVSEATIYGHGPSVRAIDFLQRAQTAISEGEVLLSLIKKELRERRMIYGYGRPLFRRDERVPHLLALIESVGLAGGVYMQLALEIAEHLQKGRWRWQMNIAGLGAAVAADMGFTPRQFHLFKVPCFLAGVVPCFIDSRSREEGGVFPLRCDRVKYEGVGKRSWKQ